MKWQGMMLAEHVNILNEWAKENELVDRPELDEFELTAIAEEIERAYNSNSTIKLTYWRDGYLKNDYGVPIDIDTKSQTIVIDDPFGTTRYPFSEIVAVSLTT